MKICILFLLSLIFLSCGDDDMKKYYRLDELRILAIKADTPEINSTGNVILTPFFSYPSGGDTTIDISYKACIDPGIAIGADISCEGQTLIDSGSSTFSTNTLGSSNFYTGDLPNITISVGTTAFAFLNNLSDEAKFNGVDIIVIFNLEDQNDSTQKLTTFKRIGLTTKTTKLNTNPSTDSDNLIADGVALASFPSTTTNLKLDGASEPQVYDYKRESQTDQFTERMTVSWFSNVGEFNFTRTDADESVEFNPGSDTTGVLVGVYRDNRGGVKVIKANYP